MLIQIYCLDQFMYLLWLCSNSSNWQFESSTLQPRIVFRRPPWLCLPPNGKLGLTFRLSMFLFTRTLWQRANEEEPATAGTRTSDDVLRHCWELFFYPQIQKFEALGQHHAILNKSFYKQKYLRLNWISPTSQGLHRSELYSQSFFAGR